MFTLQSIIYIFISQAAPCTPIRANAHLRALFLTLTDENSHLTKQLEETAHTLKDTRALLKKERNDRDSRKLFAPSIDYYCWTHGNKIARNHTSESCMYPKTRHKREATNHNNMGGVSSSQRMIDRGDT
jgi:hypothetical protein